MKINSKKKKNQKGSALVLTVIILVNALIIMVSIVAISAMERKMSIKTSKSAPAFQSAESGVDWALNKLSEAQAGETIGDVFGVLEDDGKLNIDGEELTTGMNCTLYFLDADDKVITNNNFVARDIKTVRSVGREGEGENQITRTLEAMAAPPNCPTGYASVGDFCVQEEGTSDDFFDATEDCASVGARLCSVDEWYAACQEGAFDFNSPPEYEWTNDFLDDSTVLIIGDNENCEAISSDATTDENGYRCCKNR